MSLPQNVHHSSYAFCFDMPQRYQLCQDTLKEEDSVQIAILMPLDRQSTECHLLELPYSTRVHKLHQWNPLRLRLGVIPKIAEKVSCWFRNILLLATQQSLPGIIPPNCYICGMAEKLFGCDTGSWHLCWHPPAAWPDLKSPSCYVKLCSLTESVTMWYVTIPSAGWPRTLYGSVASLGSLCTGCVIEIVMMTILDGYTKL